MNVPSSVLLVLHAQIQIAHRQDDAVARFRDEVRGSIRGGRPARVFRSTERCTQRRAGAPQALTGIDTGLPILQATLASWYAALRMLCKAGD